MKGKTPTLIGGNAGSVKFVKTRGARSCKRCHGKIMKSADCIEVSIPGSMGHKTYCPNCFGNILQQTRKDISSLETKLSSLK